MTVFDSLNLPASVLALRQLSPIEDIVLGILRDPDYGLSEIRSVATLSDEPPLPLLLVRRLGGVGDWGGDQRGFYDKARFAIHAYTANPDGDMAAAVISEAVRVAMHRAWREHWSDPDLGTVTKLTMYSEPSREPDWATSTGPVQYADLPEGAWRYETRYRITVRRPD